MTFPFPSLMKNYMQGKTDKRGAEKSKNAAFRN